MSEVWKDIDGYEGLYEVSNLGRVKSLKFGKERILKTDMSPKGYLRVQLWKNNKGIRYLVHRLVAQAFLDNPDNLPCINHRDENPSNNNVDNIEWCTHKYNINYGTCIQRRVNKTRGVNNIKNSKTVYQYSLDGELVKEWQSAAEIERQLGFASSSINVCCLGKKKTSHGYIWSYTLLDKELCYKKLVHKLSKKVYQYTIDNEFIKEWQSTQEIQRELNYPSPNISACCMGKYKQSHGYIWRYAD